MLEHQKKQNNSWLVARAIAKWGWDNVKAEILVELPDSLLNDYEKRFIDLFESLKPSGYNLTEGGDMNPMDTASGRQRQLSAVQTQVHRDAQGAATREWHKDPKKHERWRVRNAAAQQKNESRGKQREISSLNWKIPAIRKKRLDGLKAAFSDPKVASKRANAAAKAMRSDKARKNLSDAQMKKREELLAKLPPEEREKKRAKLEKGAIAARHCYQRKHGLSLT